MTFPPKPEPRVDEETDDAGIVHHSPCAIHRVQHHESAQALPLS